MKAQIKQLISAAIRNERLWKILDATVARGVDYARSERAKQEAVTRDALIEGARIAISPDLTVRNPSSARSRRIRAFEGSVSAWLLGSGLSGLEFV